MRRWLPAIALGALLAVGALAALWLLQPPAEPTTAARADALAAELRCPDCQGLAVADSPTSAAREIRRQIDELLAAGASDAEVRAHFTARYGEWILLAPSSPLPWLVPFGAVLAGVLGLGAWLVARGARPDAADAGPQLTDADRRRLHEEADALDA
jgi:cytochrome c-type biogenesis protein CcmH